jgi:SagB-type dehydrogenase family enzyme
MNTPNKQAAMSKPDISVDDYHQRSKHSLQKYAIGPDGLDWDTQPDPFRRFDGSARFSLPLPAKHLLTDFNDLHIQANIAPAIVDRNTLGALFELSMGLSAWKVYGSDRWALRINPSSGNLHPTEAYLVFAGSNMIPAGVYHYHSHDHCLEQRCMLKPDGQAVADIMGANSFLIGLSSIHWREAWKYGERAYRYCQHDVGHAIAAIRYAAALLGWRVQLLEHYGDAQIASLLGLDREQDFIHAENESADVMLLVSAGDTDSTLPDAEQLLGITRQAEWKGRASCLSPDNRIHWQVIENISATCEKPPTAPQHWSPPDYPALARCDTDFDASAVIRQRRSAQAFDGQSILPLAKFYRMLDTLLPRSDTAPFDTLNWQPRVHLVLFVHRVEGLKPGLYVLPRSDRGEALLKQQLRAEFDWTRPPVCPESLPLFHLVSANSKNAARTLSCHQAIAADGAFSISMLAEYADSVNEKPWQYKQLFWEAGIIGQDLYLEAEAAGIRATGIGCFFDDAVHETLGIESNALQVVYHFTVGTPVLDTRLISLPPYGHLQKAKY